MEHIDNFLKKLKTDRNTFLTYVLTLISFYICIDRVVEVIFIAATGMYVDLWGPIKYTLALACVTFAFHFSSASKFVTEDRIKLSFFYIYHIGLYIIGTSMVIQWVNMFSWLLLFSVPNYNDIITNFRDLIKPAFSAFAWYLPITTFYPLFLHLYTDVNDTKDFRDSIFDYGGIDLSDQKKGWGPYTCEMLISRDAETGKAIKIPESRRFESTLVVGVSGSGKTSMIFEPMVARDIEKKYFFKEAAKEMGYTALKTGLANLNSPYSNEYLNKNFNLNMLILNDSKSKLYKAYMSKMILSNKDDNILYKDLGITYMAPDFETIEHIKEVLKCYGIPYHIIDPSDPKSEGINPFALNDPIKTSIAISSVTKVMFQEGNEATDHTNTVTNNFIQNQAAQAIENLSLLLYELYPKEHNGEMPSLENLLKLLYDFKEIERLSEKMASIPELAEKYELQIQYYKANFYEDAPNKEDIRKSMQSLTAQIANLIRYPGIKNVICNKAHNINYDQALANGEVILICTRRGDLGESIHQAFGIFTLLLMQHSVLSRPGTEQTRIPHFLYIDEFTPFLAKSTASIFTLYRKYRVGTIISAQNLSQFGTATGHNFRQTIMANCTTKIVFGNNTPEDNAWWELELGDKREWKWNRDYHPQSPFGYGSPEANPITMRKVMETNNVTGPDMDGTLKSLEYKWVKNYAAGKVQALKFKQILYKTKDLKGKNIVGKAKVDFLSEDYKTEQKPKEFNFTKFNTGYNSHEKDKDRKAKFDLKKLSFSSDTGNPNNMDPIQDNPKYDMNFDGEDPITKHKNINNTDNNNQE